MTQQAHKTISILGCGWLGFPLAQYLVRKDFVVHGSTTTQDKVEVFKKSGIIPYQIICDPLMKGDHIDSFFKSEILFLNIPFKRSFEDPRTYLKQIQSVTAYAESSPIQFIVFASSTSIYPRNTRDAREDDGFVPDNPRSRVLKEAEEALLNNSHFDATIIRFAGLYGGMRKIGRFLSGQKEARDGASPVNLIHLDDCIAIVTRIIEQDIRKEIFNACSDEHPPREELYTRAAVKAGLVPPQFSKEAEIVQKIVCNEKLKDRLGYQFKHPNPLDMT